MDNKKSVIGDTKYFSISSCTPVLIMQKMSGVNIDHWSKISRIMWFNEYGRNFFYKYKKALEEVVPVTIKGFEIKIPENYYFRYTNEYITLWKKI